MSSSKYNSYTKEILMFRTPLASEHHICCHLLIPNKWYPEFKQELDRIKEFQEMGNDTEYDFAMDKLLNKARDQGAEYDSTYTKGASYLCTITQGNLEEINQLYFDNNVYTRRVLVKKLTENGQVAMTEKTFYDNNNHLLKPCRVIFDKKGDLVVAFGKNHQDLIMGDRLEIIRKFFDTRKDLARKDFHPSDMKNQPAKLPDEINSTPVYVPSN